MYRNCFALFLTVFILTAPAARAQGPAHPPLPEEQVTAAAELLHLVSDARVLARLGTLVSRNGMELERVTVQRHFGESANYTFQAVHQDGNLPASFGRFVVHAGGGLASSFAVLSVGEVNIVNPAFSR